MSAIQQIIEKLDELHELRSEQKKRRDELGQNVRCAVDELARSKRAVEEHDDYCRSTDTQYDMLNMVLIALRQELEARIQDAKQYFAGIEDAEDQNKFVEFMMRQDVDLAEAMAADAATESDYHDSTPDPET